MVLTKKKKALLILAIVILVLWVFSWDWYGGEPEKIEYGVSFSRFHTDELRLNWKETYLALLNDLGVRHFRFSVHWPLTEPENDKFNFSELDFQMDRARDKNIDVILAVGRRVPGWPECHEPSWALNLGKEEKQKEVLEYIEKVVQRYKDYPNLIQWQVENEPFLTFFSRSACGELDKNFLDVETALVRQLDPAHKIIITDSGEFGTWFGAYKRGDVFGTSMYLYIWNRRLGPLRYPILPSFFRIKHNLTRLFFGPKPAMVIELEAEPWLLQPIIDTPLDVQFQRMGIDKFNEMIDFSSKTGFDRIYLWGAEWWYWLKQNGYPEHWERAKEIFAPPKSLAVMSEPPCDNYNEVKDFEKPIPIVWTAKMDGCLVSCEGASFTRVPEEKKYPRFSGYSSDILQAELFQDNSILKIFGDWVSVDADHPHTVFDNKCVPVIHIKKIEVIK